MEGFGVQKAFATDMVETRRGKTTRPLWSPAAVGRAAALAMFATALVAFTIASSNVAARAAVNGSFQVPAMSPGAWASLRATATRNGKVPVIVALDVQARVPACLSASVLT